MDVEQFNALIIYVDEQIAAKVAESMELNHLKVLNNDDAGQLEHEALLSYDKLFELIVEDE